MNNILEFFIKMKDLASGPLVKMGQTAKNVLGGILKQNEQIKKQNDLLSLSYDQVRKKITDVERAIATSTSKNHIRELRIELEKLKKVAEDHPGADPKKRGILGTIGRQLMPYIGAAALIGGIKSAAQASIQYENVNKSFEVLSGNKGIGQALSGELNTLQQNTILGPEVFKNAQTMMGFGIGAEKVIPQLKMLGEVAMGDADRMQRLTLAFSQVQAAGKLTGQDLLQFINAGFNPLQEISKNTGIALADLKKKMEDGAISADMVTKAFESATGKGGLFNGMLDQMGNTTGGKIAQLQGSFEALKIAVGDRLTPSIGSAVTILTSMTNAVRKFIEVPIERKLQDQINKIRALQAEMTAANTSHDRQLAIFRELEQINPNIVKGIDAQKISYGELAKNIEAVTNGLRTKITLEQFDKANARTLSAYNTAYQDRAKAEGDVWSVVGQVLDVNTIARQDMTAGQKQALALKILNERVAKEPTPSALGSAGIGSTNMNTTESMRLRNQLVQGIAQANEAGKVIQQTSGDVKRYQDKSAALQKTIDGVLGIKSMNAAHIANTGGKSTGTASMGSTGKEAASGITGGGPRVVNINGVKFTDKIEIHGSTIGQSNEQLERALEEMFLRILNSGASLQ